MDVPDAYRVLGLPITAIKDDVEARYRRLALVRHPDQGGDGRAMAELNQARQVALAYLARARQWSASR